jgi:hypothetical protein
LEGQYNPLRSNLSYNIFLPQPADYNFILRLFPTFVEDHTSEVQAWLALKPVDRIRAAVLYSAVLSSASTTTLYGLNITENLVEWSMGLHTPPFINEVLSSTFNSPSSTTATKDVVMLKTPKKAFRIWLACSVAENLYCGSYWNCPYGGQHNAAASLHGTPPFYTPQLLSPLVCDNWLHVRPIEWGISAPQPKANFKGEIRVWGALNRQGWYASLGSRDYINIISSDCPIKLAPYANVDLNVIRSKVNGKSICKEQNWRWKEKKNMCLGTICY